MSEAVRGCIKKLVDGVSLQEAEAEEAMEEVITGRATNAQVAGYLVALRMKGETPEEIAAMARVMRRHSKKVRPRVSSRLVDTCGTGGDRLKTFNVSTTSAFVVAGAGVPVAKHGNRSFTSRCGSADLLESLGVKIEQEPEAVEEEIEQVGIGFMFAPMFHPAMAHAMAPRRELGVRTVFNILGPLTSPAGVEAQVLGVFDEGLTTKLAIALQRLGAERAIVAHGLDGLDEVSTVGMTKVVELDGGRIREQVLSPEDFGVTRATPDELLGGSVEENAAIAFRVLNGEEGPRRDFVLVNSACGIMVGGKAESLSEGMEIAEGSIDSGRAYTKLRDLVKISGGSTARLEQLEELY